MQDGGSLFKKILVPLDGSEHSTRALEVAIEIAKKFNAKITLIHVYSVTVSPVIMPEPTTLIPPGVPVMIPSEVSKVVEAAREAGSKILSDGEQKAKAEQVEVETVLKGGQTVSEIVKLAKEGNSDLVVIGARGVGRIKELILGSVSDGVMRNTSCPILLVK